MLEPVLSGASTRDRRRRIAMWMCFALGGVDLVALNAFVFPRLGGAGDEATWRPGEALGGFWGGVGGGLSGGRVEPVPVEDASRRPSATSPVPYGDVMLTIGFESESAALSPEAQRLVDALALELKLDDDVDVRVEGHADTRGDVFFNEAISVKRAEAVRDRLIAAGIEEKRIETRGMGSSSPRTEEESSEAQALNRRVEVIRARKTR
jgi:outer membrane protein OmpA-like peptidoglycan-associated protein